MKNYFLILSLFFQAAIITSNAQDIEFKNGFVTVDDKNCFTFKQDYKTVLGQLDDKDMGTEVVYQLYDLETGAEVLFMEYNGTFPFKEDGYFWVMFMKSGKSLKLTTTKNSLIRLLIQNKIITADCKIDEEKIEGDTVEMKSLKSERYPVKFSMVVWDADAGLYPATKLYYVYYSNLVNYLNDKGYTGIAVEVDETGDANYWKMENGIIILWTRYFGSSDTLESKMEYKNRLAYEYEEYFSSGKLKKEVEYCDGNFKHKKIYNEQGDIIEEENGYCPPQ